MIAIDPQLARGSCHGGMTFHDRGGPYGATKGAKRVVAVDVTGLPVGAIVVPASTNDGVAVNELLERIDTTGRLELVLVDRGTNIRQAQRMSLRYGVCVQRVRWDTPSSSFRPIRHAWKDEVAHGPRPTAHGPRPTAHGQLSRSRRLAKSFENTLTSASAWLQTAGASDSGGVFRLE